ncbi:hypothetical protein L6452_16794 [Arctium lappa]|uniref:Uncharacterized protein n=1 Tax=Arctium lappa TaxID=4217 RepID=A0ACB9C1T9_ARCLA|nr:hypothetical protein L6452_16794 [Arctium lappa]
MEKKYKRAYTKVGSSHSAQPRDGSTDDPNFSLGSDVEKSRVPLWGHRSFVDDEDAGGIEVNHGGAESASRHVHNYIGHRRTAAKAGCFWMAQVVKGNK